MKKIYSLKRVVQLCTALLFTLILSSIIYSCRKELKMVPLSAADSVDAARSWYESAYPVNTVAVGVNNKTTTLAVNNNNGMGQFDYSQYIKPDWNHSAKYKRFNKDVIEMPVDPSRVLNYGLKNKNTGQLISAKENSRAWFILLNDGKKYEAYVMVLIGDSSYIEGNPARLAKNSYRKRDANFSGMLLYFTPKGQFLHSYKYVNGTIITGKNTTTNQTQQVQSVNKQTNELAACIDWYWTTWDSDGDVVSNVYLYTTCTDNVSGGGSGGAPTCQVTNAAAKKVINGASPPPVFCDGDDCDGYPPPDDTSTACTQPTESDTTKKSKAIGAGDHALNNSSNLPPQSTTNVQFANLCVFKTIEWVSAFYGPNVVLSGTSLTAFVQSNPNATYTFSDGSVQQVGLGFIATYGLPDQYIHGVIGTYFFYNTTTSVIDAINANNPVMAAIEGGDHQVFITGYNNDGTYTYFDPAQGSYYKQAPSGFTDIVTITGMK